MLFNVGDTVSRNSYKNDILFKIIEINNETVIIEGINERLVADANLKDLKKENNVRENDDKVQSEIENDLKLDRNEFFYLPGKVLHIDADKEYLERCLNLYKKLNVKAYGVISKETEISKNIKEYLENIKPDIVVITGHDAKYLNDKYKNSDYFIESINEARKYERSHEKLVIVAGACQSNYEELIKAGANFASSPKRINIHALDPAIVASQIALSDNRKQIDLLKIINSTKYKSNGFGGIITNGTMYVGYPR